MSKWTHAMCAECWVVAHPDREPVRIKAEFAREETCCFCGRNTRAGIYVRENPEAVPCKGIHEEDNA